MMIDFTAQEQTFVVIPALPYFGTVEVGQQFTTPHPTSTFTDEVAAREAAIAAGWVEPVEEPVDDAEGIWSWDEDSLSWVDLTPAD